MDLYVLNFFTWQAADMKMLKHKDMLYCTVSCTKCGGMLYLYTTCNTFKEKNKEFLKVVSQVTQSEY
jgi:cobyrinic acid a,c-diamide synthase